MPFWCGLGVKLLNPHPESRDWRETPPGSRPDVIARARIEPDGSPAAIARCALRLVRWASGAGDRYPLGSPRRAATSFAGPPLHYSPSGASRLEPASLAVRSCRPPPPPEAVWL